jgi:carotenoid 1,2-hydratase
LIRFDQAVPDNGYAWWYIDAISDDGTEALTLIGFVGSVFSPYYARAIKQGRGVAERFCAINLALYRPRAGRWAMTERSSVQRDAQTLSIGPSALRWTGSALEAEICEVSVPVPHRLRGRIRVLPQAVEATRYFLDAAQNHYWQPIAPCARIEVMFERPALRWSGHAYLDHNAGSEPVAAAFRAWSWSRMASGAGAVVCYDARRRDGSALELALRFSASGGASPFTPPPLAALDRTAWRLEREARADPGVRPVVRRRFEDAPFYARAQIDTVIGGERGDCVHESLDLDRLRQPIVQAMLPFRMPRWG